MRLTEATVAGETLQLHYERVIYWPKRNALLIADLHLGKIGHFRKHGVALPEQANDKNLQRLHSLMVELDPKEIYFLGDLFHSDINKEWEAFLQLLYSHTSREFHLIIGNHDIIPESWYNSEGMFTHNKLVIDSFLFTHEPLEKIPNELYNLCGHIHPAVRLHGKGRQAMRLPCFYFGKQQGILPAFGEFTGGYTVKPKKGDQVFVLVDGTVLAAS